MHETPSWFVLGLQLAGILLIIASGILMYRTTIRDAERRRDAGMADAVPVAGRIAAGLLRAKVAEGVEDHEVRPLQLLAQTLLARRPMVLFAVAFPLTQLSTVLQGSAWWHKVIAILLSIGYLAVAVQIERNARAARAFLRRYPLAGKGVRTTDP